MVPIRSFDPHPDRPAGNLLGGEDDRSEIQRRCPTPLSANAVHSANRPTPPHVTLRPIVLGKRRRTLLKNGWLLAWRTLKMYLRHGSDPTRMAGLVARFANDTGGAWVRLASFLADHRFTFPDEFCQILLELRERTYGFPFEVVREIVETDLGRPLEQVFESFDENPMAALFTSQTHKARLRAGHATVAVKVQRPGTLQIVHADLRLVRRLLPLLLRLTRIPRSNWEDGIERIAASMEAELDYRLEATQMNRMGGRLRKHKVLVPRVYLEHSGRRTLTKEFVAGVTVAEFVMTRKIDPARAEAWCLENDVDPEKTGRRLFESLMRQVLEEDLFDRDWNPYNTLLLKGNRVAIVDFWAMVSMEKDFQMKIGMLMRSIARREFRKAADYFILVGPPVSLTHDASEVRRRIIHALRNFDVRARAELLPYEEKSLTKAFAEIGRALADDGTTPTLDLLEVDRALRVLDLSLKELMPRVDMYRLQEQFQEKAEFRRLKHTLSRKALRRSVMSAVELVANSPDTLSEQLSFGAELVRRQAKVFRQTSSKIAHLMEEIFGLMSKGLLVAAAVLVLAFFYQSRRQSLPNLNWVGPRGLSVLSALPVLDTLEGALLLLLVLYLAKETWHLKRRFGQKTISRPDGSD